MSARAKPDLLCVLRSGSWSNIVRHVHVVYRTGDDPSNQDDTLGLRLARRLA